MPPAVTLDGGPDGDHSATAGGTQSFSQAPRRDLAERLKLAAVCMQVPKILAQNGHLFLVVVSENDPPGEPLMCMSIGMPVDCKALPRQPKKAYRAVAP